ncbi:unnamed protein product [Clavelina lepadiformis]|uniref:Uncharacterized protein n=1 Tax=Clavelina lepadiformis TaxID=159417 RepID=A0ABP0GIP0_CLALP
MMYDDDDDDDRSSLNGSWLNVAVPVVAMVVIFLTFLTFYKVIWEKFRRFCCTKCTDRQTRVATVTGGVGGHDNNAAVLEDDVPPSYSALGISRSSLEIFRVACDEESLNRVSTGSDSEKLPSYAEFMEEMRRKEEEIRSSQQDWETGGRTSHPAPRTMTFTSPHAIEDPEDSIAVDVNLTQEESLQ